MCDDEQTASVSTEEWSKPIQVDSEAINAAAIVRPLGVLGLSEEQTCPVEVET